MSFTNLYYKRTAGTERGCYICHNPTTTVLSTINTVDFFYVCPSHLKDRGFGTLVGETDEKPQLSPEEIERVKAEWEAKQKRKEEKRKEQEKEKEKDKDKNDAKDDNNDKDKDKKKEPRSSTSSTPASPPTPITPSHEKYALHRDIFALRQVEHRKRRQTAQAKSLAPRLPGAPTGALPSSS